MKVNIRFERSDALAEGTCEQCRHTTSPTVRTLGPFDWVEMSYLSLRIAPEGESVAYFDTYVDAWVTTDGEHFSDVLVEAAQP